MSRLQGLLSRSDGLPQVMEEIAGGAVIRTYTYGHERISQTQLVSGAWATSYYGYDAHGDVRFLTDASGSVADRYEYNASGNLRTGTHSGSLPRLRTGEQYDRLDRSSPSILTYQS